MSSTSHCRREEVAFCQPDRTIITEHKQKISPETSECTEMSEKQFMRDHSLYSALSSWLFAIAGATNIGVLGVLSSKILNATEKNHPIFKSNDPAVVPVMGNKKYNRIAVIMTVFGGVCMLVSNWLESKKVVTEWQLGAGKLQRKLNVAEKEVEQAAATQISSNSLPSNTVVTQPVSSDATATTSKSKGWVDSVQSKITDSSEHSANIYRQ